MPPKLALCVYFLFVFGLFRNARTRRDWSKELWIPLIWILIIGTKTPSEWIAIFTQGTRDPEGSPLDTAILIGLLLAGLRTLAKTRTNWQRITADNKWLFLYFAYIGVSVLWADKPFASLKLWVKDVGNLIMVLVILSQHSAIDRIKSVLVRASYIFVPLSVLLIKYFPEIGRGYDKWTYQPIILGANDSKNTLGATILLCLLTLLLDLFTQRYHKAPGKLAKMMRYALVLMTLWLLFHANCATAVACSIIGIVVYLIVGYSGRSQWQKLARSVAICALLLMLSLHYIFDLSQLLAGALGRDMTLTARTDIWRVSVENIVSPLVGSGYASFWNGERAHKISVKLGFFFDLKEAHNGYLETYLNSGLVGSAFLVAALITSTARIIKRRFQHEPEQAIRLVCIIVALVYNMSESAFAGLNLIWFSLLLMLCEFSAKSEPAVSRSGALSSFDARRRSVTSLRCKWQVRQV